MTEIARSQQVFSVIELLLCEERYEEAKGLLAQRLDQNPLDRESKLSLLLVNVTLDGPRPYEDDIDQLRSLCDLNDIEREIVRRLFVLGFESAEKEGRENQAWAYQRLLRRLLLSQALDQPIPKNAAHTLPANQVPAPKLTDSALSPVHNGTPAPLSETISLRRLFALSKEMCSVRLSWFLRASQTAWKPKASPQAALAIAAVALLIILIAYFSLPRAHTAKEAPGYANAVLSQPKLTNSVSPVDPIAVSQRRDEAENTKRERVHNMVADQLPSLRRAYGRWLQKNRNLMGSLLVKMEVDAAGNVVKVEEVASRLTDSKFRKVVLAEARKWTFRNAKVDAAAFTVALRFVPKDVDSETIVRWERTLNLSDAEAKAILPFHITSPLAVGEERKSTIKANESSADLKAPKTIDADASKTKNLQESLEHWIDYKTLREVPLRQEPRFAAATTQDIDAGATISVLEAKGDWLKVKTRPLGAVGYVRKEYLSPASALQ